MENFFAAYQILKRHNDICTPAPSYARIKNSWTHCLENQVTVHTVKICVAEKSQFRNIFPIAWKTLFVKSPSHLNAAVCMRGRQRKSRLKILKRRLPELRTHSKKRYQPRAIQSYVTMWAPTCGIVKIHSIFLYFLSPLFFCFVYELQPSYV